MSRWVYWPFAYGMCCKYVSEVRPTTWCRNCLVRRRAQVGWDAVLLSARQQ